MRKYILLGLLCLFGCLLLSYRAEAGNGSGIYSQKFISHLVKCKKYKEEIPMEFFGMPVTQTVVVEGRQDGKCVYSNFPKESPESKYTCYFTKEQLQEILETSKKDLSKQETYKGEGMTYTANPLSVLFTKYLNDGSTCTIPKGY